MKANAPTTQGDCNWKPQPNCDPAARRPNITPPSNKKETKTPTLNAHAESRISLGRSACCVMLNNLMAKTGNTQGMKFNKTPPKKAPSKAKTHVANGAAFRTLAGAIAVLLGSLPVALRSSVNSCHCPCMGVSKVHCRPVGDSAVPCTSSHDILRGLSMRSLEIRKMMST